MPPQSKSFLRSWEPLAAPAAFTATLRAWHALLKTILDRSSTPWVRWRAAPRAPGPWRRKRLASRARPHRSPRRLALWTPSANSARGGQRKLALISRMLGSGHPRPRSSGPKAHSPVCDSPRLRRRAWCSHAARHSHKVRRSHAWHPPSVQSLRPTWCLCSTRWTICRPT
jgi:hypothetical protein